MRTAERPDRTLRAALLFVIAVLAMAGGGAAPGSRAAEPEPILVSLDRPDPFAPARGTVEIHAVVSAEEEIERVVFYVDQMVVGQLTAAPYRLETDVGDDNVAHRFEVIAHGRSGATGSTRIETPPVRIDDEISIRLQQLYVTVTRQGSRVGDLGRRELAVFDDGERQELVTFTRGDVPFTAVVLVDSSTSMAGDKLSAALAGAEAFVRAMQPLDEAKLLAFSDRVLHDTPFTTFPEVLTAGLGQLRARGGTALNDHLYLAMKELEQRQGRRVVILLSDGVDSHSVLSMTDVLDKARRSQALIYWLRLPYGGVSGGQDTTNLPAMSSPWRDGKEYRREFELLRRTVDESGGRIQVLSSLEEIEPAFEGIVAELRDQYVLGYYPPRTGRPGTWHRVRVRISRPGLDVRSRNGYVEL